MSQTANHTDACPAGRTLSYAASARYPRQTAPTCRMFVRCTFSRPK